MEFLDYEPSQRTTLAQDIRQPNKVAFCSQTNVKTYYLIDSFGIYSAETCKPHLLRKGQLHVLTVLSQLLYGHFVQPNEVASSHPVTHAGTSQHLHTQEVPETCLRGMHQQQNHHTRT